jgi:hypothetical protein
MEYNLDDYTHVFGATKFVGVQNAVCFPDNLSLCGGSLYVHAQTINTNGTWTMDVYDDQTNLFASLDGDVDSDGFCLDPDTGEPGIVISLLDTNGDQLPSVFYDVTVTTYPAEVIASNVHANGAPAGGGASSGFKRYYSEQFTGAHRNWVIAYMPVYGDPVNEGDAGSILAGMMEGAAQFVHDSAYVTLNEAVINQQNTTWGFPYTFTLKTQTDWTHLMNLLNFSEARNLVCFGHGWSDLIGKRSSQHLSSDDLQFILKNIPNPLLDNSTNPASLHPYRFVFLDACNTANGNLPEVFGIPKKIVSADDWDNKYHPFQRAFLGWNTTVDPSVENRIANGAHTAFFERIFALWSGQGSDQPPMNLGDALNTADQVQNFWTGQYEAGPLGSSIIRYGCPTLPFYQ